jgi:hypothetical protein
VIRPYLPEEWAKTLNRFGGLTLMVFIALFLLDTPVQAWFWRLIGQILLLLGVNFDILNLGIELYRFW